MKILQWLELKIPPLIQVLVFALLMWIIHQNTSSLNDTGSIYLASTLFLISLIISLLAVFKFRTEETTVDPRTPNKTTGLVIRGIYSELMQVSMAADALEPILEIDCSFGCRDLWCVEIFQLG